MAEYNNIYEFVREFFMYSMISQSKRYDFDLTPLMLDGMKVLDYFSEAHLRYFRPVFLKIQYEDLQTDEQLLELAVPRCLNLIDNEKLFYSFMLVACYLRELIIFIKNSRLCYRFHLTVYKCFLAVFNRKFVNKFEIYGGLKGLGEYLNKVKYAVIRSEGKHILKTLTETEYRYELVIQLIRNCNDVLDDFFTMNDYERLSIIDDENKDILKKFADDHGPDIIFFQWPPRKEDVKLRVKSFLAGLKDYPAHNSVMVPSDSCTDSGTVPNKGTTSDNFLRSKLLLYTPLLLSDSCDGSGRVSDGGMTSYGYLCSDLSLYISLLVSDAEKGLPSTELTAFREAMKSRMCSSCGMKCFQLSCQLFMKQFNSVFETAQQKESVDGCILSF